MTLTARIEQFIANAYSPNNLASARDQLTQAIFLLQEVVAEPMPGRVEFFVPVRSTAFGPQITYGNIGPFRVTGPTSPDENPQAPEERL